MSLQRCVSELLVVCLYNKLDEVDTVSPMSLKRCVSVAVVELSLGGSATNVATPSSFS